MPRTYYGSGAIQRGIDRISRPSAGGESVMYGHHSLQTGSRGLSDFEVHQYVGNTRRRFVVVQFNKPGGEFGGLRGTVRETNWKDTLNRFIAILIRP
ncbi:hypothetical protein N7519_001545 [Penicillium mononematosum]|uniref:uncharacterized protein n=1 Tax=Penicillium mononematosum TaxID=268346 RepID=UPI00254831BC|nr:uncharacterized protein N7519_001545 [Penicillium mononematosum]KAJ6191524.1 hypothetical protein N7519_001545 [Penicillium mononematosum]